MTSRMCFPKTAVSMIALWFIVAGVAARAQTFKVLHTFHGKDGAIPTSAVIQDDRGNLYGTTNDGGAHSDGGTVFEVSAMGKETVLYSFTGGADGAYPYGGVIRSRKGDLYGTTLLGGDKYCRHRQGGCGLVFRLDAAGKKTVLHRFRGYPADGATPYGTLIQDNDGNLYDTTLTGGASHSGTVFEVSKTGHETVLFSFMRNIFGGASFPYAGVIRDSSGNLYGTTYRGGILGAGSVFKPSKAGQERALYNFTGGPDGGYPVGELMRDGSGNLYGTTEGGGIYKWGTVFKVTQTGQETVLYAFTGGFDGFYPYAGLVRDAKGNLYGTTLQGGNHDAGTVVKLDEEGVETVLYSFTGGADGAYPEAGLSMDKAGNLYGTTSEGGDTACGDGDGYGCGVVFKITP